MKICKTCGVQKEDSEFREKHLSCRGCHQAHQKLVRSNPETRPARLDKERVLRNNPDTRDARLAKKRLGRATPGPRSARLANERAEKIRRKRFFDLLKTERGCYDCGGMFPPEALDWDHLPGSKKCFSISFGCVTYPTERVIDEISKCQLVCACCHRTRTVKRRQEKKKGDE